MAWKQQKNVSRAFLDQTTGLSSPTVYSYSDQPIAQGKWPSEAVMLPSKLISIDPYDLPDVVQPAKLVASSHIFLKLKE